MTPSPASLATVAAELALLGAADEVTPELLERVAAGLHRLADDVPATRPVVPLTVVPPVLHRV